MTDEELIALLRHADAHSQQRAAGSDIFARAAERIEALTVELDRVRHVYDAASEWWVDRVPKDAAEHALCHALNNTAPEMLDDLKKQGAAK